MLNASGTENAVAVDMGGTVAAQAVTFQGFLRAIRCRGGPLDLDEVREPPQSPIVASIPCSDFIALQ